MRELRLRLLLGQSLRELGVDPLSPLCPRWVRREAEEGGFRSALLIVGERTRSG